MSLASMSLPEPKTFIGALSQVHEILVHNQWSGAQLRDLKRLFTNDFFRGFGKQTRICRQHRQNVATLAKGLTRSDSRRSNVAAALMAALGVLRWTCLRQIRSRVKDLAVPERADTWTEAVSPRAATRRERCRVLSDQSGKESCIDETAVRSNVKVRSS